MAVLEIATKLSAPRIPVSQMEATQVGKAAAMERRVIAATTLTTVAAAVAAAADQS